jgi:Zn-finger nucleic acid-binding protein
VTCPTCGAPMRLEPDKECLVCDYCGNIHFPEANTDGVRVLEEQSTLECPTCRVILVHAAVAGHRILYCGRCRGMLIGMDIFMAVVQDLRSRREPSAAGLHPPDWKDMNRRISCPQCGQAMDTHLYGGGGNVIIDDCETCSLNWLDYAELDRIVRAPDREYVSEA